MFRSFIFRLFPERPRQGPYLEMLVGMARVIDGDTIVVAGQKIRIHGIDAPEMDQTFSWCGRQLVCGTMSFAALEALIAGIKVRCEVITRDHYGRLVAKCFSPNGVDIGKRLVSSGWAVAYRRYSHDYVAAELEARKARRGMWRGTFDKPWVWRAAMARINAAQAETGGTTYRFGRRAGG